MICPKRHGLFLAAGAVLLAAGLQAVLWRPTEPFYNNDETRHIMTGVFFRDFLVDLPLSHPREYTVRYYVQYPALGLLVWPPLFYVVEGAFMLIFGTSVLAAKCLIGIFAAAACLYLYRLAERTHGARTAGIACLLFLLSPLVFLYSRQVMLEIPTLALALAAHYHLHGYLIGHRRRDLLLGAIAAALCMLTRFDGVLLVPAAFLLIAGSRAWTALGRREVWLAILLAAALVAPAYSLTAIQFGKSHLLAITEGTSKSSTSFLDARNLLYYRRCIPSQMGWFIAAPLIIGILACLRRRGLAAAWPHLSLIIATYVTFTPMAELEERHAIYWVPALAVLAADGIRAASSLPRTGWLALPLAAITVAGTALAAARVPVSAVSGYETAARYALDTARERPLLLMDGLLNGNFIYQVRRLDPQKRVWTLRGDKVLYGMLSDPHTHYTEFARSDEEVLQAIHRYDPELIIVEEPQVLFSLPAAERLRNVLRAHPERFRLEVSLPVESNLKMFAGVRLDIYRSLIRNPSPEPVLSFPMIGMGRTIEAAFPGAAGGSTGK